MPFLQTETFLRKHGLEALERFQRRCNEGASLKALSCEFGLSVPTVHRVRAAFFRRVYVMREGVQQYLEFQASTSERETIERRQIIQTNLRLVPGSSRG